MANLSDVLNDRFPFEPEQSPIVVDSNYTASNNETIFVNTASAAITVTLPSSPSVGSKIKIIDSYGNAGNNNITILGNSYNINGASAQVLDILNSSIDLIFINTIKGWNIENKFVPLSPPGTPTNVSAIDVGTNRVFNDGAADVSFSPSVTGDVASSYQVTAIPGNLTATGSSSPIRIEGLDSNVEYSFKVKAINDAGSSIDSSPSSSINITTVPEAPTLSTVGFGFEKLTANYTSNSTGGKSITSFTAIANGTVSNTGSGSSITIGGLTGGDEYSVVVTATNSNGTSSSSNSISSTPFTASGGTITTYSNYRVHTFTGASTFNIVGNTVPTVDYLIVGGGGGGGGSGSGQGAAGGAGAGRVVEGSFSNMGLGSYSVAIGSGGSGGTGGASGTNGNSSSINSITGEGGGYGGGRSPASNGGSGGSGGGGGGDYQGATRIGGSAIYGAYGNSGGNGWNGAGSSGGGGGGAATSGGTAASNVGGTAGAGRGNSLKDGTTQYYGGGGGGGDASGGSVPGGIGGGGYGGVGSQIGGTGDANTGGGGGGGAQQAGGSGGSGIVVLRYEI